MKTVGLVLNSIISRATLSFLLNTRVCCLKCKFSHSAFSLWAPLFSRSVLNAPRWSFIGAVVVNFSFSAMSIIHVLQCHCFIAPIEGALLKAVLKSQHLETRLGTHGLPTNRMYVMCVFCNKESKHNMAVDKVASCLWNTCNYLRNTTKIS